ncbi:MAG TPA: universal stress protein [Pyrinomonadaceae bacterium]|jgi:nucleotide-binding universal stress UspA family protein
MKILLAVDSSEYSAAATKEVAKRPWPTRSTVRVLSVAEPLPPPAAELWYDNRGILDAAQREMRQNSIELSRTSSTELRRKGLKIESVVRDGHPRTAIVDEAEKWRADLIVMGSHGRTGLTRLLLGSVAQYVVGHAPCSVEVVRQKKSKRH